MKKIIGSFLISILICMGNSSICATNASTTMNADTVNIIDRIAAGSDEIIGNGIPFEDANNYKTQYTSGGTNHTHQYIVAKAITILRNNQHINFFDGSIGTTVMKYSDKPDDDDIGVAFAPHFWDPDTNKNYIGQTTDTAKTRFIEYYESAVEVYNSDPNLSYEYLGRALHYLADIGEPHHASNKVAVLTNHSQFEKWVDKNRTNFYATSSDKYSFCINNNLTTILKALGKYSKSYSSDVEDEDNWTNVANNVVPMTQKYTAALLYRYLNDVGVIK